MLTGQPNPAVAALAAEIKPDLIFGQVLIRRTGNGFELRHHSDHERPASDLRLVTENEIRALAQFNATGAFRPLKPAPNLQTGWRIDTSDDQALGTALDHLYPGAVADWFAVRTPPAPVTSFRQFTARQTGMYRITTLLDDATAGAMIRACCHRDSCLKQRLWTVEGLEPDQAQDKSLIPCLEPCAILLEFARRVVRLEQQETPASSPVPVPEDAIPSAPSAAFAECDFDAPDNPRRVRFVLEKRRTTVKLAQG